MPRQLRGSVFCKRFSPNMEPNSVAEPKLLEVLKALIQREPIFHRPEFGTILADFERMTEATFREVGTSGRRYSRQYVLNELEKRYANQVEDAWQARDFHCLELAADNYLLTSTLIQGARVTQQSGGERPRVGRSFPSRDRRRRWWRRS